MTDLTPDEKALAAAVARWYGPGGGEPIGRVRDAFVEGAAWQRAQHPELEARCSCGGKITEVEVREHGDCRDLSLRVCLACRSYQEVEGETSDDEG